MLSIIAGKPGSGKTYHMATILVAMLLDWVRYELKNNQSFDSTIWTNIVFNIEGLNETLSKQIGKEVDVAKYITFCDQSFFNDLDCAYWWQKFPAKSVIIIDEVHFHLGRKVDYGSLDLESELVNWISTHRHSQQEIYFLTQHTDQFANQILGIADTLYEIVNVKTLFLKWPISVPMADIDELKRSFGIKTQFYQTNVGKFRGKAVRWDGSSEKHMMTADVFRVYQSHDVGVESSDRPSLKMSPLEGVCWFARRHAWHLLPKLAGVILIPFVGMWVLIGLPDFLMASVSGGAVVEKKEEKSVVEKKAGSIKNESVDAKKEFHRAAPQVVESKEVASERVIQEASVVPVTRSGIFSQPLPVGKKIVMLYQEGVMCDDGTKVSIGETLDYEGKTETLACVSIVCGIVGFESGKKVRF